MEVIPTGGLHTSESGLADSFAVRLRTPPLAPVSITFRPATPSEANLGLPSELTLVFDGSNWSTVEALWTDWSDDRAAVTIAPAAQGAGLGVQGRF